MPALAGNGAVIIWITMPRPGKQQKFNFKLVSILVLMDVYSKIQKRNYKEKF